MLNFTELQMTLETVATRKSGMQRSSRVDYDANAELYDSTPHREKSADPELIAFLAGCGPAAKGRRCCSLRAVSTGWGKLPSTRLR